MATQGSFYKAISAAVRRLVTSKRGNVALTFAVLLIPLVGMVGAAVDYSNAYRVRSRVQNALDATSLAVNRSIGSLSEKELQALARTTFAANLGTGETAELSHIDISVSDHVVTLTADTSMQTIFMAVVGIDRLDIQASSTTVTGLQTFEVALVLDNSGSMAGSKISDLRTAASALADVLFAGKAVSDTVSVGVVPFSMAVNVGPQYRTASWIDSSGLSSIANDYFSQPVSRFELFDNIRNTNWAGCVESRPHPFDVNDEEPQIAKPDTLFVPMFAPDEPDRRDAINNYLDDYPGGSRGSDNSWSGAQNNIDKYYKGVSAKISAGFGTHYGPNFGCEASPLTPLTYRRAEIDTAFSHMNSYGGTNIMEAVAWGWRILSPDEPFTEGVPYGQKGNFKVIVLMTDGANNFIGLNNPNMSFYSTFGFADSGRVGGVSNNQNALQGFMDALTKQACTKAKHEGILIYTVGFELDDKKTVQLLQHCASKPEMAFVAENGSELIATFKKIAAELSALRISR